MPLENSVFRIVHRTDQDPHGVNGYFIHELYLNPDQSIRCWRAGISVGALDVPTLKNTMIRVLDAFNYEPIEYQDLTKGVSINKKTECTVTKLPLIKKLKLEPPKTLPGSGMEPK